MPQIFHPATNTLSKVSILGALLILAAIGWVLYAFIRSDYVTQVDVVRPQPVQFSHEHHVSGLGIDCRYCHTSVETSPFAGIPPTETCMNCHSQIWSDSPMLAPVRASFRTGRPLAWTRVHDLPDFAYFDHSIHVQKGIGCATCHGRVDRMPLAWRESTLQMQWCLDCHRRPERFVRPRDKVFDMTWEPPADRPQLGIELVEHYKIHRMTDCSTCHR
jgi:hypothetical protein